MKMSAYCLIMAASNWHDDFNEEFVNLAQIPPNMAQHMRNAVQVSFQKYGTILDKSPAMLKKFQASELKKLAETGNHERLVNAANYSMFLYTIDKPDPQYLQEARAWGQQFNEAYYEATDSNQSVTRIQKPVNEWIREHLLSGVNFYDEENLGNS